jgi:hypothetical protein
VLSGIGADGAAITSQVNEYNKLVMERMRVAENASENSPRLKDFDRRIEALRPTITASIDSYVSSIKLQLKDARKNERSISGQISNMPAQQREALTIVRQQELKNALYTYLLNKREEVALQLAINEANVRLVENPMSSGAPISPKTNIILFISFVLGIVIPAGIIFLIDMFDTKLKYRADIEKVCTAPVVAELPVWENHSDNETIANLDHNRPIVESFRLLRYGLNFMKANARTMVITSSTPGQGKTFVSKNIAVVLGMAGKKVLLVDADIRKCTMSKSIAPKVKQCLTH